MTTLNSAFQSLLSSVSDLNLNEGDFLKMNNLLKKAFDSDKENLTDPLDIKLYLKEYNCEDVVFEFYEFVREQNKEHPHCKPIVGVNYRITKGDTTKSFFCKLPNIENEVRKWVIRTHPMVIKMVHDGFESKFKFSELLEYAKMEHKLQYHDDEEEDDCDCNGHEDYKTVMIMEVPSLIERYIRENVNHVRD